MGRNWKESLEEGFKFQFDKQNELGCKNECQQRCMNETQKERAKKSIDIAYHYCVKTQPDNPELVEECNKIKKYYERMNNITD